MIAVGKRVKQKAETRERILKAAYHEFSKKGIQATKTAEIARSAKLSHGAIFVHFATREDILASVIDQFGIRLGSQLEKRLKNKSSVREILKAHLNTIKEFESFYTELVILGPQLPKYVRGTLFMVQNGLLHYFMAALENEIPSKRYRHLSKSLIFNTWMGLVHYYVANRDLFAPGRSIISKQGNRIIRHFLNLIDVK